MQASRCLFLALRERVKITTGGWCLHRLVAYVQFELLPQPKVGPVTSVKLTFNCTKVTRCNKQAVLGLEGERKVAEEVGSYRRNPRRQSLWILIIMSWLAQNEKEQITSTDNYTQA